MFNLIGGGLFFSWQEDFTFSSPCKIRPPAICKARPEAVDYKELLCAQRIQGAGAKPSPDVNTESVCGCMGHSWSSSISEWTLVIMWPRWIIPHATSM